MLDVYYEVVCIGSLDTTNSTGRLMQLCQKAQHTIVHISACSNMEMDIRVQQHQFQR